MHAGDVIRCYITKLRLFAAKRFDRLVKVRQIFMHVRKRKTTER